MFLCHTIQLLYIFRRSLPNLYMSYLLISYIVTLYNRSVCYIDSFLHLPSVFRCVFEWRSASTYQSCKSYLQASRCLLARWSPFCSRRSCWETFVRGLHITSSERQDSDSCYTSVTVPQQRRSRYNDAECKSLEFSADWKDQFFKMYAFWTLRWFNGCVFLCQNNEWYILSIRSMIPATCHFF